MGNLGALIVLTMFIVSRALLFVWCVAWGIILSPLLIYDAIMFLKDHRKANREI